MVLLFLTFELLKKTKRDPFKPYIQYCTNRFIFCFYSTFTNELLIPLQAVFIYDTTSISQTHLGLGVAFDLKGTITSANS